MRLRKTLVACALMTAVAACGERSPVDNDADGAGLPDPVSASGPNSAGAVPENAANPAPAAPRGAAIPAALHGRWGLTPADCMSRAGDNKGLLVITEGDISFYESSGVPGPDAQADEDSINGRFSFTGEGQSWTKFQSLKLSGTKLIRTETNPAASYTYAKC